MDRRIAKADQLPTETEFMEAQRFGYEAMGQFFRDVLGTPAAGAWVFGFACAQTTVASLSFLLGPGRLYALSVLDATAMGQSVGPSGGLTADTNVDHKIFKQGLYRDTVTLGPLVPPGTAGQSKVWLVEAQFATADDAPVTTEFYNTAAPDTPISSPATLYRRDLVSIQIKAGAAAATGSQVTPAPDAGWVPLWAITLANGATTITAANIAIAPGAPFVTVGSPVPVLEPIVTVGDATGAATLVAGVLTIDCSKTNYVKVPMTAAITSLVFNSGPPAGVAQQITAEFIGDGTAHGVTGLGQASIKWAGPTAPGAQPAFDTTVNRKNKVVFTIRDGLSTQDANFAGITAP